MDKQILNQLKLDIEMLRILSERLKEFDCEKNSEVLNIIIKRLEKFREEKMMNYNQFTDIINSPFTFEQSMYWQRCPICEGKGQECIQDAINYKIIICSVCKGKKIIDATGNPPKD